MFSAKRLVVLCILVLVVALPAAAQNLVVNGSFESPLLSAGDPAKGYGGLGVSFAENSNELVWGLSSWAEAGAYVELYVYYAGIYGHMIPDGGNIGWMGDYPELGYTCPTEIYQTISTVPGQQYTLKFHAIGTRYSDHATYAVPTLRVTFGSFDETFTPPLMDGLVAPFYYTEFTRTVTATSNSEVLSFMHVDGFLGFDNIILEAVQTEPIPEPGSLLVLAAGVSGLLAFKRRSR